MPVSPFCYGVFLLKLNSRKKRVPLLLRGLLGNLEILPSKSGRILKVLWSGPVCFESCLTYIIS